MIMLALVPTCDVLVRGRRQFCSLINSESVVTGFKFRQAAFDLEHCIKAQGAPSTYEYGRAGCV
jgi:hypothetical protein